MTKKKMNKDSTGCYQVVYCSECLDEDCWYKKRWYGKTIKEFLKHDKED